MLGVMYQRQPAWFAIMSLCRNGTLHIRDRNSQEVLLSCLGSGKLGGAQFLGGGIKKIHPVFKVPLKIY